MLLLFNNLHEKSITESQDGLNLDSGKVLFVTCTHVTTLHLYYMKNTPVVSQSEVWNFFIVFLQVEGGVEENVTVDAHTNPYKKAVPSHVNCRQPLAS